jgi:urease beta subunit
MKGLFYPAQVISDDKGDVVGITVSGPIQWDEDETSASIYVSISQGDRPKAHGRTGFDVLNPATEWMVACPLDYGVELEDGGRFAIASATAVVFRRGETEIVTWPAELELQNGLRARVSA